MSYRTLVLLDGHRIVSGDVNGAVNINDLPQSLINRVDVITGGASAAYGSDALAGVVNFGLDKEFSGFKSEVQGGVTTHGDNESYKANLTFSAHRSPAIARHVIATRVEYAQQQRRCSARWPITRLGASTRCIFIANPAYNAATGNTSVPQFLIRRQAPRTLLAAPRRPHHEWTALRGTSFAADGTPTTYQYGPGANSQFNVGGDWRIVRCELLQPVAGQPAETAAMLSPGSASISPTT